MPRAPISAIVKLYVVSSADDMRAMGRIAATRLYQLLEGADPYPWSVLVPTSLVIRESA